MSASCCSLAGGCESELSSKKKSDRKSMWDIECVGEEKTRRALWTVVPQVLVPRGREKTTRTHAREKRGRKRTHTLIHDAFLRLLRYIRVPTK